MRLKSIVLVSIAFLFGASVYVSEADQGWEPGVYIPEQGKTRGTPSQEDLDQWYENWSAFFGEEAVRAAVQDDRGTIPLTDGVRQIKVITMGGGAFEGSFIWQTACKGGDIRGLFTAPGEFAMALFNYVRYDGRCGVLKKGDLDLPPPLSYTWLNEVGLMSGSGTLEVGTPGVWFHESVNDYLVQDWVAVSPNWSVNSSWNPSATYDMAGTGASAWSLTYYGARTYPRPAHDGFQYEVCIRKNSGGGNYSMSIYFNGDGTMDNCVHVPISTQGRYSAWERSGGTTYTLINWTDAEDLFQDDLDVTGENVFNMVKVNVYDDGVFDIYINEQYIASAQAQYNLSGYVGIAIYDSIEADHVSCDNMTLSTVPLPLKSIANRRIHQGVRVADPMQEVSAK